MKKINLQGKVALVTGANKGIGRAIVIELINQGAAKVYAGSRNINNLDSLISEFGDKVVPLELDVTNDTQIKKVVELATDINILVNNAGALHFGNFTDGGILEAIKENFEVNVYGTLKVTQAFLPTLKSKEQAAILNVSSIGGLANMPMGHGYSVSKAAVHSITQGLRGELKDTNVFVAGIYPGPIDTEMGNRGPRIDKDTPENVAISVVNGLQEGTEDIYPDMMAMQIGEAYASSPKSVEQMFARFS
ncbi:MAG: NADP-dependent 3-hydroxy acid dehydrogenase YdfG [Sediminicola sp.]|jgi:NADP-dependent 3-hydroxy acid dehydrogenase YdfG